MKKLNELCQPRKSVFNKSRMVADSNMVDLMTINHIEILSENCAIERMRIFLTEAINGLEGKTPIRALMEKITKFTIFVAKS